MVGVLYALGLSHRGIEAALELFGHSVDHVSSWRDIQRLGKRIRRGLPKGTAIAVRPGRATIHYSIPTPEDSPIEGGDAAEVVLNGGVMNMGVAGGDRGTRTPNLGIANAALSQLSYIPTHVQSRL